jgi:hypothetical protein
MCPASPGPIARHVPQPRQGPLPPLSSCSAGRAAIATSQAGAASALSRLPGARSPPRPHSQGCHDWSDPLSTASTAPSRPGSRPLWAGSWLEPLNWGLLFCSRFPPQLTQGRSGMTFLSCSKGLPIWNPQFGGEEGFHVVWVQKPLKALYS